MRKKQNKIYIIDVTNRDGVQTARLGLAKLQKPFLIFILMRWAYFSPSSDSR